MHCDKINIFDTGIVPYSLLSLVTPKYSDMVCSSKKSEYRTSNKYNDAKSTGNISADVLEYDDKFIVKADLPGISKENIKISIKGDILNIEADSSNLDEFKCFQDSQKCSKSNSFKYHLKERRQCDNFELCLSFPDTADFDKVSASFENGLLRLEIQKKIEEFKKRDIMIQ